MIWRRRRSHPGQSAQVAGAELRASSLDRAYLTAMISHLQLSVTLAADAARQISGEPLSTLIAATSAVDRREIALLQRQRATLVDAGVRPGDPREFGSLVETPIDVWMLHGSMPVERAYSKAMIFHRRGGLAMAAREISAGCDPVVVASARRLAESFEDELRVLGRLL